MRKVLILLLISIHYQCFAQITFNPDSIPVSNGKIVFRTEFKTDLKKEVQNERVTQFLNASLNPYSGEFSDYENNLTVCRITDYIDFQSGIMGVFAMYMTYIMTFEYKDNSCVMTIRNIRYMEKEYFELKEQSKRKRAVDLPEYSGEDIMIEEKYKLLTLSKASQKVTVATVKRINEIIKELEIVFLRR
jgi:hypothetical protein